MKQLIGLIDVDGHNFPNFALMRASSFYKCNGSNVEWALNGLFKKHYDEILSSKIFTFSKDINYKEYDFEKLSLGGTGYDIKKTFSNEIESHLGMDYTLYPMYKFSVQFFSRGCIRHCPFCLVHDKEGSIHSVEPVELNPHGEWIEVLDNNFFANPDYKNAVKYLNKTKQPVNLHGVDARIMNEEQAYYLNTMKLKKSIHIAWDLPKLDLTDQLISMLKYIKAYKIMCYVLVGFNSTIEQDMFRIETLRKLGIKPYVMVYRDYNNTKQPSQYCKDLASYVNKPMIFKTCSFADFSPRKGFKCMEYLK